MTETLRAFYTEADLPLKESNPGSRHPVLQGSHLSAVVLHPTPQTTVPDHTHDEEVLGVVMDGYVDLVVDGAAQRVEAPGYYHIPAGVVHSASGGTGTVVEVFAPARPDLS